MRNEYLSTFYAELVFEQGPKDLEDMLDVGSISSGKIRILSTYTNTYTSQSTHILTSLESLYVHYKTGWAARDGSSMRTNGVEDLIT